MSAARAAGAHVLVDASQAAPHLSIDVQEWDADFAVLTAHKMLGPSGVGVLWASNELLSSMPPFMGGGSMIETVTMAVSTYEPAPDRFEAGTPAISQAIGLAAACDYLTAIGMDKVKQHETTLTARLLDGLRTLEGASVLGPETTQMRGSAVSFVVDRSRDHTS